MQEILTEADLRSAILQLERKQAEEGKLLKEQFHLAYESIMPLNLIKSTFNEVVSSPFLIDDILGTALGLTTGYLSKKIVVGASGNIVRKLLGSILQFGVTNIVARNPEGIKSFGQFIFKHIIHKKEHTLS
jgi:hypothetical protein